MKKDLKIVGQKIGYGAKKFYRAFKIYSVDL
jgi:hypothetical protein